jgi:hypothetical protein
MPTITQVAQCFDLLFAAFHSKEFAKSHKLNHWKERDLLPLIRVGLLCYFGKKALPEVEVATPWTKSLKSRIDFRIGDTAVEFAVRNPGKSYTNVAASTNTSEVKKLLSWKAGKSVLVLFDFSDSPFTWQELQWYREHPRFGKGNRTKNAYSVLYFYVVKSRPRELAMHLIQVRRRSRTPIEV